MNKVNLIQTGLTNYNDIWNLQKYYFQKVTENRDCNYLIFTEHKPVITIGKSGGDENIVANRQYLKDQGIAVVEIDRGGDITYHGPGQIVVYPILNLLEFKKDIHWYLRSLEEIVIQTLIEFAIPAQRIKGLTGVWVGDKKICAIGIKVTRWVSMHGIALNVSPDLNYFNYIIPCGIKGKGVTSIFEQIGNIIPVNHVILKLIEKFEQILQVKVVFEKFNGITENN